MALARRLVTLLTAVLALVVVASAGGAPPNRLPSSPTNLAVTATPPTSVSLAWNASPSKEKAVSYGLYVDGTLAASTSSLSATLGGLSCETAYTLGVDAVDTRGMRSAQTIVAATTGSCVDTLPPSVPTNLAVAAASDASLSLWWSASFDNVGVARYELYQDGSRVGSSVLPSFTFSGLACGTVYTLGVDAVDAAGNRSQAASLAARTAACPVAIGAPQNVRVSASTESSLALAWDLVAGASKYGVYRNGTRVAEPTTTTASLSGLSCGTSYTLGVDAVDLLGNRSQTTTISAATSPCAAPPPPSTTCTKTLSPGGSLSTFANGLKPGETGCLRGGSYSAGSTFSWSVSGSSSSRIVLTEYPGEQAEIVGTGVTLSGSYLTLRDLTIRDITTIDISGIAISGAAALIENNRVERVTKHGIILHTSSRDAVITRNFVADIGRNSSTLEPSQLHGIYVQASGHRIVNNVFLRPTGYGIHLYSSPSNIVVAQNTLIGSLTRAGILIRTSGTGIRVINNVSANNATHGINYHSCGGDCLIDNNLTWNNPEGSVNSTGAGIVTNTTNANPQFTDGEYRLASTSPAVDSARSDYSYSPARDTISRPQGNQPDKGAYERTR